MAETGSGSFWDKPAGELLRALETRREGLTSDEAARRLRQYGPNVLKPGKRRGPAALLLGQFAGPIILILVFAAVLSVFVGDRSDAVIILAIVLFSGLLGYRQERGAENAVRELLSIVRITAAVVRDSSQVELPVEELVVGDIVLLHAGDVIPADSLIVESRDLYVDEAALTGETFPVEKRAGVVPAEASLPKRTNAVFMGTHVVSGTASVVIARTGGNTEFGAISGRLAARPPETEFEHGIRRFGYFLMEVTLMLVVAIFAINVYFKRPVLDSFLFSMALAVGLTPQLLPAIISINLSKGARRMADHKVIVKRMAAIENFGSMNVFCSDKTGTLTEGRVSLAAALDAGGRDSERTLLYARLNATLETGFTNPIDEAIRGLDGPGINGYKKLSEVPYDFSRKRLSVLVSEGGRGSLMITKGALSSVLDVCSTVEEPDGRIVELEPALGGIGRLFNDLSERGLRTLGIAYKEIEGLSNVSSDDEREMTFLGIAAFSDPPKQGIEQTIGRLKSLGVGLKVITGDNRVVAESVSRQVGLEDPVVLTGSDLESIKEEALIRRVSSVDVFAEVEPNQKERVIGALSKAGNVVGYMGDGINDAPALHAADVGISVEGAVDVAKEAADFVLLETDLEVLVDGVREGRSTFANTMKYVFMATSANFGNMFSMAGASLFLSFLPLLPGQVLLTNLMTDFPEMTIATDSVDTEMVEKPHRWDLGFIRRFMLVFGLLSSVFDYATFGALLWVLGANQNQFRTGWFVESVISASLIVLVIRTRRVFFRSRPGNYLFVVTLGVVVAAVAVPYTPIGGIMGFAPVPASFYPLLAAIVVAYVAAAEMAKRLFYRLVKY